MASHGRVLFMRHPETVSNVEQYFSGRRDVRLSEKGEHEAARAAQALVAWKPDTIVSSPLSRCRAIADVAARELGLEVVVDERLIEIDFGSVEGVTKADLPKLGITFPWPIVDGASRPAEGAESFEHLIERASSFVGWVSGLAGKTACVTHGGLTRAIFAAVYGEDLTRFWNRVIPNVSSQVFVSDGSWLSLQSAGLTPEELTSRSRAGYVPGDAVGAITSNPR